MLQHLLFLGLVVMGLCYQWASFDMLAGVNFYPQNAFFFGEVASQCTCGRLCYEDKRCFAFGVEPFSYRWRCAMFNNSVNMSCNQSINGLIGGPYVPGASLLEDCQYYFVPSTTATNFSSARALCNETTGFRLALLKTVASFDIAVKYQNPAPYLAIDMMKKADNSCVLGDGTLFTDTSLASLLPGILIINDPPPVDIFIIARGAIHDENEVQNLRPLCQGNLFNIVYK